MTEEANLSAAELRMPESAVRESSTRNAEETAERLGARGEAMRWRLYSFGLRDAPA
jgi:Zn-dependent peptidase ImmA (M78 family)